MNHECEPFKKLKELNPRNGYCSAVDWDVYESGLIGVNGEYAIEISFCPFCAKELALNVE